METTELSQQDELTANTELLRETASELKRSNKLIESINATGVLDTKVVVGIPCYNEENSIAKIILGLRNVASEVIVCDDGSTDMTADIARALGCRVISHERNSGKGTALRSLFLAARKAKADVFVTIDGDGQHDVKDIPRLVSAVRKDMCDIAIGSRFEESDGSVDMPKYRRFGSRVLNSLVTKSTKSLVKDTQSGLRAYSRHALFRITPGEEGIAVDTEILTQGAQYGMRIKEFPATIHYDGLETSKQHPVSHSLEVISGTLKYMSIRHPLKFYGIPAGAFFLTSIGLGIWTAIAFQNLGYLPFGPTVATISIFMLSIILGAVGVILFSLTTVVRQNNHSH